MGSIWDSLVRAYAVLAVVPIVPFLLVFAVASLRGVARRKAVMLAMDVTTVFLIGSVANLLNGRFGTSFGLYILILLMLIGGGLIGNAQNRVKGRVDRVRLFRAVWRLSFFALATLFVPLFLLELIFPTVTGSG